MPLYEYACRDCGHRFEVRQGIRDEPLTECPNCSGAIRRVVQPVGIVFKGSGFYKTDSRSSSETSAGAGERKTETKAPAADGAAAPAASATPPASTSGESSAAKPASAGTASSTTGS